jgi:hypothetical protein
MTSLFPHRLHQNTNLSKQLQELPLTYIETRDRIRTRLRHKYAWGVILLHVFHQQDGTGGGGGGRADYAREYPLKRASGPTSSLRGS